MNGWKSGGRILSVTLAILFAWIPCFADSGEQDLDAKRGFMDEIQIHGFGSLGFLTSSENNYLAESKGGSFDFNELALSATFNLRDDLRVGAQIFVGDMGDYGNYEPRLDWGDVDWRPKIAGKRK